MLSNSSSRPTGFSIKSAAPAFMACTAIGTSPLPVIMIDGKSMAVLMQALQQFQPTHAGQTGVDQQAGFAPRMIGFEERLATPEILDRLATRFEHGAHHFAHVAVIIDDENDRRPRIARPIRVRMRGMRKRRQWH